MSRGPFLLPDQLHREVVGTVQLLSGLVDPRTLVVPESSAHSAPKYLAVRALPQAVRRRILCTSAVYAAWDRQCRCRYVGSVCRGGATAVGDRLAEHFQHVTEGHLRRVDWVLLTAIPIRTDAPLEVVRAAEGWAARRLAPFDGKAHPQIELARPPSVLARELGAGRLAHT